MKRFNNNFISIFFLVIIFGLVIGYYQIRDQNNQLKRINLSVNSHHSLKTKELPDTLYFCHDSLAKQICNYLTSKYQVDFSSNEGVFLSGRTLIMSFSKNKLYKMKNIALKKRGVIPIDIVLQSIIMDKNIYNILEENPRNYKIELYAIKELSEIEVKNISFVETSFSKIKNFNIDKAHQIFSQFFEFNYKLNYKKEISPLFK